MGKIIKSSFFLTVIFYLFIVATSMGQMKVNDFIANISKTNKYLKYNNIEYRKQLLKESLEKQNISLDSGNYLFIPFFRIEFKNLANKKRNNMKKKKFFSYLSSKKLEFVEMYIYKDSLFYGVLREDVNNEICFIQNSENITRRAKTFYYEIYRKINPEIILYIRRPFSEMFVIQNERICPIRYVYNSWKINTLNDFFNDKRFNQDSGYVHRCHDKPFKWVD